MVIKFIFPYSRSSEDVFFSNRDFFSGEEPITLAKASIVRGYCQHFLLIGFKASFKVLFCKILT